MQPVAEIEESGAAIRPLRILIACVVAAIVLLIPLSATFTSPIRITAAAAVLMAMLWLLEAMPMGLTALLPLIIFPLSGTIPTDRIAAPYANSAVFLFLGGFLVATTVEKWSLHKRIAYAALTRVGTRPRRIVLAVLLVTAALSMWISNTATTLMLTPIAVSIARGLGSDEKTRRVATAILLAVAYGASLGGLGTPIGTPTNLIFFGAAKEFFPTAATVSFAQWMAFGAFYLLFALPVCWLLLLITNRIGDGAAIPISALGIEKPAAITRPERLTIALFTTTALLWVFRGDIAIGQALTIPGWANLFPDPKAVSDTTVAIVMSMIAFIVPIGGGRRLLDWSDFRRVPWDVLILFGGGFALADAMEKSGMAKWAGTQLEFVRHWPPIVMIFVICVVVTFLSEIASNVATATAMMPVCAALAVSIGVHPYLVMIPAVFAASSGFMLPVATAPNTIVFSTGLVPMRKMAISGLLLDIVCAFIITAMMMLVMPRVLGYSLLIPLN